MKTCCTCRMCRRSIGLMIERLYRRRPAWRDEWTVQEEAGLGWVDSSLFRSVFRRMIQLGLLIESRGPDEPAPVYHLACCLVPAKVLAETTEGGRI